MKKFDAASSVIMTLRIAPWRSLAEASAIHTDHSWNKSPADLFALEKNEDKAAHAVMVHPFNPFPATAINETTPIDFFDTHETVPDTARSISLPCMAIDVDSALFADSIRSQNA